MRGRRRQRHDTPADLARASAVADIQATGEEGAVRHVVFDPSLLRYAVVSDRVFDTFFGPIGIQPKYTARPPQGE